MGATPPAVSVRELRFSHGVSVADTLGVSVVVLRCGVSRDNRCGVVVGSGSPGV
jgi:hypothetical protein